VSLKEADDTIPCMGTRWLTEEELTTWVRLVAFTELLPGALDSQLRRDSELSHFEYLVLAMLSEAPVRTLQMSALAQRTNATLPRLSHVVRRLEERGFVERRACPGDGRATNATLTDAGWDKIVASAPGHVEHVRRIVFDALTPEQVTQLDEIAAAVLTHLDPEGRMSPRQTVRA
jgi:DNA-binding MarR family transcriptional regulator